jgi:holo-[acyl-carrier protein] synthase
MTLRSGVDILEIERLRQALNRHGERFLMRIYTPAERELCAGNLASLAVRFAAKEAVSKALGSGLGEVAWTDIEVLRLGSGEPLLYLHGRAATLSDELGLKEWSISLSHSHEHAVALAVAQG